MASFSQTMTACRLATRLLMSSRVPSTAETNPMMAVMPMMMPIRARAVRLFRRNKFKKDSLIIRVMPRERPSTSSSS